MAEQFVTVSLADILVGEPLPVSLYIYIDFRFITLRADGDVIDRTAYDRLEFKKVKNLFILDKDKAKFFEWSKSREPEKTPPLGPEQREFANAREDVHRRTM